MPKVKVNGIDIYYEEHGSGEPVVMIGGLGADTTLWSKQVPAFSERFRVVVFDNRGSGQSDKPDEPYSIPMFAADTVGLMQALGIERAHVVGASLGGLVAQELVLTHPEMVDRLVLVCTTSNGPRSVRPSLWSLIPILFKLRRTGDPAADTRRAFEVFAHPQWMKDNPDEVEEYVAWRVDHSQPRYAFKRQRGAIQGFHTRGSAGHDHGSDPDRARGLGPGGAGRQRPRPGRADPGLEGGDPQGRPATPAPSISGTDSTRRFWAS